MKAQALSERPHLGVSPAKKEQGPNGDPGDQHENEKGKKRQRHRWRKNCSGETR